jgi:asparaginyl-tRNA synthetase
MLEPEVAFYDLNKIIKLADNMCKTVIKNVMDKHPEEFKFFKEHVKDDVIDRLQKFIQKDISIIDYQDAIKELQKHNDKFETKVEGWVGLGTEHEKFLAEKIFEGPVAVINYPKELKAFYMYQNEDKKTVAAFDILVPGIGELVGGSQREHRYDNLMNRIRELKIDTKDLQ